MIKSDITVDLLHEACLRAGYVFFERGDYNLNIIGIRSADKDADTFNDALCLAFKQSGRWVLLTYDCTTDPGTYYRTNPLNPAGTAILAAGQHRAAYTLGLHQGNYEALVQAKALPVYRDADEDGCIDMRGEPQMEWGGFNIHHASAFRKSWAVDKWSAGCQVAASPFEFDTLLAFCKLGAELHGKRFTYTLFDEREVF